MLGGKRYCEKEYILKLRSLISSERISKRMYILSHLIKSS